MDLWLVGAIDTPATPGAALLAAAAPRLGTKGGVEAIAHYGGATGKLNRKGLVLGTVAGGRRHHPLSSVESMGCGPFGVSRDGLASSGKGHWRSASPKPENAFNDRRA